MMATSEERMKILQMVQEGKISADDGAKLLAALREGAKKRRPSSPRQTEGRQMRVKVTDMITGKTKVSVTLPMGLVGAGLNIASQAEGDKADPFTHKRVFLGCSNGKRFAPGSGWTQSTAG